MHTILVPHFLSVLYGMPSWHGVINEIQKNMIMEFYTKASIIKNLFIPKQLLSRFIKIIHSLLLKRQIHLFHWEVNSFVYKQEYKILQDRSNITAPTGPILAAEIILEQTDSHFYSFFIQPLHIAKKNCLLYSVLYIYFCSLPPPEKYPSLRQPMVMTFFKMSLIWLEVNFTY